MRKIICSLFCFVIIIGTLSSCSANIKPQEEIPAYLITLTDFFTAIENNDDSLLVNIMDRTSIAAAAENEELKCADSHFGNAKKILGESLKFEIKNIRHYKMSNVDLSYINADYASKLNYDFEVKSAVECFFELDIKGETEDSLLIADCNAIIVQEGTEWRLYFLTAMSKKTNTPSYIAIDKFPLTFQTEE